MIGRALLLAAAFAGPAAGQTVVTGISTDKIALTADFTGSEILVFGAIRRDAPIPPGAAALDVIITLSGPPRTVTVRRKERRFGVWTYAEAVRVRQAPSYYAIATTRPLDAILSETEQLRWGIGLDEAVRRVGGHPTLEHTEDFTTALVRLRLENGLYARLEGGVALTEETLFQVRFAMPTNLVEGDYAAEFFLVSDEEVINSGETTISVEKEGLSRRLFNLAQDRPFAYGLLSVALALAAGWLASAAFRLARR